jgi:hypothetical protein
MERFNLKKLYELEGKKQYRAEISNRFTAKMIASLDARFNVRGVVKPGSVAKSLIKTV